MRTSLKQLAAATTLAFGAWTGMGTAHATPVALELALVIDVSSSVNNNEYLLQRDGYRDAFNNPFIGTAIESFAGLGGIAVSVFYFANNVVQVIDWTQLTTAAQAAAFGNLVGGIGRPGSGTGAIGGGTLSTGTNIAEGVDRAVASLDNNVFVGARRVIDVSGDGVQNRSRDGSSNNCGTAAQCADLVAGARNDAAAKNIVINGLAIEPATSTSLFNYYDNNLRTGPNSFVLRATFETFSSAVTTKIGREITNQPVSAPGTLALAGLSLLLLGTLRRRAAV